MFELNLEGLTQEQLNSIKKQIEAFEKENEKPKNVIDYENGYVITNGEIREAIEYYASQVNNLYSIGLYRDTRQECEKLIKKMKIEHRLREWSKLCKDKIDWSDVNQAKWHAFIDVKNKCICYKFNIYGKYNEVYFTDKSILEKAIEDIGEQKLIDEYFVEI